MCKKYFKHRDEGTLNILWGTHKPNLQMTRGLKNYNISSSDLFLLRMNKN